MGEINVAYCPRCNQRVFEIEAIEMENVKLNFVQCAGCKAPVGVVDPGALGLTEVLRVLVSSLQKLNSRLEEIEQALKK
jgi:NAD-dependent SIR2 family protein deacetylase